MYEARDLPYKPTPAPMSNGRVGRAEFMEAGAGPLIVLVHSSMAGARQWSHMIRDVEDRFWIRVINLFGYGGTPAWSDARLPFLDVLPTSSLLPCLTLQATSVSFSIPSAAVDMQAAARQLKGRIKHLVLIEPRLFCLPDRRDRRDAFHEISLLAHYTKRYISHDMPDAAAERFIDYWCGPGSWAGSSSDRRRAFRAVDHRPSA